MFNNFDEYTFYPIDLAFCLEDEEVIAESEGVTLANITDNIVFNWLTGVPAKKEQVMSNLYAEHIYAIVTLF